MATLHCLAWADPDRCLVKCARYNTAVCFTCFQLFRVGDQPSMTKVASVCCLSAVLPPGHEVRSSIVAKCVDGFRSGWVPYTQATATTSRCTPCGQGVSFMEDGTITIAGNDDGLAVAETAGSCCKYRQSSPLTVYLIAMPGPFSVFKPSYQD